MAIAPAPCDDRPDGAGDADDGKDDEGVGCVVAVVSVFGHMDASREDVSVDQADGVNGEDSTTSARHRAAALRSLEPPRRGAACTGARRHFARAGVAVLSAAAIGHPCCPGRAVVGTRALLLD